MPHNRMFWCSRCILMPDPVGPELQAGDPHA